METEPSTYITEYFDEAVKRGGLGHLDTNPPRGGLRRLQYLDDSSIETCKKLMEELTSGMEITCTFADSLIRCHTSDTLTRILRDTLVKVATVHKFRLFLVGEFSKIGRYHMHGMVYSDGRGIDAIKKKLQRDIGLCHIKQISFTDSYIKYIFKSEYDDLNRNIRKEELINLTNTPLILTTVRR